MFLQNLIVIMVIILIVLFGYHIMYRDNIRLTAYVLEEVRVKESWMKQIEILRLDVADRLVSIDSWSTI